MRVAVDPSLLREAARELDGCAGKLDGALHEFLATAARDVPEVGKPAYPAVVSTTRAAQQAVDALREDVRQLAAGLREVAIAYQRLDRTLIAPGR